MAETTVAGAHKVFCAFFQAQQLRREVKYTPRLGWLWDIRMATRAAIRIRPTA